MCELRFEDRSFSLRSRTLPFGDLHEIYQGLERALRNNSKNSDGAWDARRPKIILGHFNQPRPLVISSRHRALVSAVDSHGISSFAGISRIEYLTLCCMLAVTQLKALALNPEMQAEDLPCSRKSKCLFSWQDSFPIYATVFDERLLCEGCADFYHTLGVGEQLFSVNELITSLQSVKSKGS